MNKGMLAVGIIILSLISLLLINVLSNYSTGQELDYYLVKETTEAAMSDAIDRTYLRTCGLYRIDKEKFVESFLRRFAANVDATRGYEISFYDINEVPPKASVQVDSTTTIAVNNQKDKTIEQPKISTSYDAILETQYLSDMATEIGLTDPDSDYCKNLDIVLNK